MKKTLFVLSLLISLTTFMAFTGGGGHESTSTGGAPAGFAGDPQGGGATCRNCHAGTNLPAATGILSSTIPPAGYTPGVTYTITANFVRPGHSKFGFSATPQNAAGVKLGTLANITGTQIDPTNTYITHVSGSTSGSGSRTWTFRWTAPAAGQGPVTFYAAFNATNNNNNDNGDSIFKTTMPIVEDPNSINDIYENKFLLSSFPNPTTDFVNVRFTMDGSADVEIGLLGLNGNKIQDLLSERMPSGETTRSFDISQLPKGVYFIRIDSEGISSLQKVVKL